MMGHKFPQMAAIIIHYPRVFAMKAPNVRSNNARHVVSECVNKGKV
jgi:hypothetical protein